MVWETQHSPMVKSKGLRWKSSSAAYLLEHTGVSPHLPVLQRPLLKLVPHRAGRKAHERMCGKHTAQCWVYWQPSDEVFDNEPFTHPSIPPGGRSRNRVQRGHSPARGKV